MARCSWTPRDYTAEAVAAGEGLLAHYKTLRRPQNNHLPCELVAPRLRRRAQNYASFLVDRHSPDPDAPLEAYEIVFRSVPSLAKNSAAMIRTGTNRRKLTRHGAAPASLWNFHSIRLRPMSLVFTSQAIFDERVNEAETHGSEVKLPGIERGILQCLGSTHLLKCLDGINSEFGRASSECSIESHRCAGSYRGGVKTQTGAPRSVSVAVTLKRRP